MVERHAGTGTGLPVPRTQDGDMLGTVEHVEVRMPKLDGNRVALRGRVAPETHEKAVLAARHNGLSLSDYLAMLIERDTAHGQVSATHREELPIPAA